MSRLYPQRRVALLLATALLFVGILGGVSLLAPPTASHVSNPPTGRLSTDTIGINAGDAGTTCLTDTTCNEAVAAAANSVFLIIVTQFGTTAPTTFAVHGYTPTNLSWSGAGVAPVSYIYGFVATTAATLTAYVNFTVATYYDLVVADFTNTITTASYFTAGVAASGSGTATTCSVTTTVANEMLLDVTGVETTAESTITPTSPLAQMFLKATTSSVVTQETADGIDTVTGAFAPQTTLAATSAWRTACLGLLPAVAPQAPTSVGVDGPLVNTETIAACATDTTCTTTGIAVAAGSAVWVFIAAASVTAPSGVPTDSAGHTYTLVGDIVSATTSNKEEYVYDTNNLAAAAASLTVTETFAVSTTYSIGVIDFVGVSTTSLNAVGTGSSGTGITVSDNVTATVASTDYVAPPTHLIILGVATATGTVSLSASGGDTMVQSVSAGVTTGGQFYTLYTGSAKQEPMATLSAASPWAAIAFSIESALNPSVASKTIAACSAVTTCTTTGIAVIALSSLYVFISAASVTAPATETTSPSYTLTLAKSVSVATREEYVYDANLLAVSASLTVTVTFAASTTYTIGVVDVIGAGLVSLDAVGAGATGSSVTASNAVTMVDPGDLDILGVSVATASETLSATGGDTLLQQVNGGTTTTGGQLTETYSVNNPAVTLSATLAGSEPWAAVVVAIAVAGPTTTFVPLVWVNPVGPMTGAEILDSAWSGSCGTFANALAAASPYTSGTVTGLTSGSAYCFEVTVSNSTGASVDSLIVSDVVTAHKPLAPTALTATAQPDGTTQINLAWTVPSGNALNQTVARWTGSACPTGSGTYTNIAGSTQALLPVTGLTAGTAYSFEVQSWNDTGAGTFSSCATASTYGVPGAPTGLSTTAQTEYTIALAWTNPSGTLANDTILMGTTCGTWSSQFSEGVASSATVSGLAPLTTYCFNVEAWSYGSAGTLDASTLSVETLGGIPGTPASFVETSAAATTVSFMWTNPAPTTGALTNTTFFYGSSCGALVTGAGGNPGTWTSNINVNGVPTSYTVTGLASQTTYCFSVALWTQGGQGGQAIAVTTSTGSPIPSAPTNFVYVSASHVAVTVAWTQPSGAVLNDTVAYTTASGCGSGLALVSTGGAASTMTVSGLTSATTYYWEVAAWSNGGESAYSSCITGATQSATPPAPYDLAAQLVGQTFVNLTWINPSGYMLTNNIVYVSNPGGSCGVWSQTDSLGEITAYYEVTGLTASSSYCIEVTAVDAQSPYSAPLNVTTPSPQSGGSMFTSGSSMGMMILVLSIGVGSIFALVAWRRKPASPVRSSAAEQVGVPHSARRSSSD